MQAAKERARQNAIDKGLLDIDKISPTPGVMMWLLPVLCTLAGFAIVREAFHMQTHKTQALCEGIGRRKTLRNSGSSPGQQQPGPGFG